MEKKQKGILFPYLWKYKFSYILGLLTLLIVDYMSLYIPQLTGDITDGLSTGTLDIKGAGRLCLYILLCAAIIAAGRFLYRYFIFGSALQGRWRTRSGEKINRGIWKKHTCIAGKNSVCKIRNIISKIL